MKAREICIEKKLDSKYINELIKIQSNLITIGGHLATPRSSENELKLELTSFPKSNIQELEQSIDEMDNNLEKLTHFILPSGGMAASSIHICK